jgi:hypothetical protein
MKRAMLSMLLVSAIVLGAASAWAGDLVQWVHVRVDQPGETENVKVNVPLSLVEAMIPLIEDENLRGGKIKLSGREVTADQLRAIHDALVKAPDGEYITVDSPDELVRVAKSGGYLLVNVDRQATEEKKAEHVEAYIPMPVVEALLSTETEELDLIAAVHALAKYGDEQLVSIVSDDATVRVWVDGSPAGEKAEKK